MAYRNSKAQAAIGVVLSIGPKASAYTGSPIAITATTTSGSATLSVLSSTTGLVAGQTITGTGIPANTTIVSINTGASTLVLSNNATATGTLVAVSVGPFIPMGEVSSSPVSGQKWDLEEVTNFDSLQYKEFLKTLVDTGKMALTLNRVSNNGGQIQLKAAFIDPAAYQFQITLPLNQDQSTSGDSATFAALVETFDDTVAVGKAVKLQVGLQRTGAITTTLGS